MTSLQPKSPPGELIDVVMPARNRAAALVRAVRSVQAQTVHVHRIIIVDDASTDDTQKVVAELNRADPRIELLSFQRRTGAAAARNRGVTAAASEWIAFIDSDDEWLPGKLERQIEALNATPYSVACFTGHKGVAGDRTVYEYELPASLDRTELLGRNVLGTTSSAMVRRDVLISIGGFDEDLQSCQDWDLWVRLQARGNFALVTPPLVVFALSSDQRITKNLNAVRAGHRQVFAKNLANVSRPLERLRIMALHRSRMAEIMAWDFDRPGAAAAQALIAALLWPSRRKLRFLIGLGQTFLNRLTISRQ